MRMLSYTRWPGWQGFPNLFSPGETAMPSLRSAAVGKLLLCTKSTTCFTNPAKLGICCGRGSLATSPFNFLRAPCFVGCLFWGTAVKVNYRTSVSCYTLSKVGCSFVCSVQDTCSEKKKNLEIHEPSSHELEYKDLSNPCFHQSLFLAISVRCTKGYPTGGKRSFVPLFHRQSEHDAEYRCIQLHATFFLFNAILFPPSLWTTFKGMKPKTIFTRRCFQFMLMKRWIVEHHYKSVSIHIGPQWLFCWASVEL